GKRERLVAGHKAPCRPSPCGKIQKHFIHNQSKRTFAAKLRQARLLLVRNVVPSRIVRMHNDHCTRPFRSSRSQRAEIDLPAMVINQWKAQQFHIAEIRQKIEERIPGSWDQHLVSRIAYQSKQERIRFARSGGEHDVVRTDELTVLAVV